MAVIILGPGSALYFLATKFENKFIELPYLGGYDYTYDQDSVIVDSIPYHIPEFNLTKFDGTPINNKTIEDEFIVLTTIQNGCPNLNECGTNFYIWEEIFYNKFIKNLDNYDNVKILTILTDLDGNQVDEPSEKLLEEMEKYDTDVWWMATGDPTPLFSFEYYDDDFVNIPANSEHAEIGGKFFVNSVVLIDDKGHVRGVSMSRTDSGVRNFFDMLKLLKKVDFDKKRAKEKENV